MLRNSLLLAASLAALTACNNTDRSPVEMPAPGAASAFPTAAPQQLGTTIVPQSHIVPPGRTAAVRRLFSSGVMSYPISVVGSGGVQTQFVQPKPVFVTSDRFVADVPPEFHVELDRMIAEIAKSAPPVSSTYDVTYWVIEADAAPATDVPADLAELAPTFEAMPGLGKRKFKSIDRVASRTVDGEKAELRGRVIDLKQTLFADPDDLRVQLELRLHGVMPDATGPEPSLDTTLQLKADAPIVLGDSTLSSASEGQANLLLYVVRARRVD
jgi:hypothetical protein